MTRQWVPMSLATLLLLVPLLTIADEPPQKSGTDMTAADQPTKGAPPTEAEATTAVRDALAKFAKHCPPPTGGTSNTRTWKVRMECLVTIVKAGPPAVPVLLDALKTDAPWSRAFAAQALGFLADPATKPALLEALEHENAAVRLHASRALGRMGKLKSTPALRQIAEKDESSTVQKEMTFTLTRDEEPNPAALRKVIADYDLKRMASATVGKSAPEFALPDTSGKVHSLRQFRGKEAVVLVFLQHSN
jgi:HEAT repeat protein